MNRNRESLLKRLVDRKMASSSRNERDEALCIAPSLCVYLDVRTQRVPSLSTPQSNKASH